ncbi:MAG: tryptophan--tRNA ligase [Proteobacteria bacterium]|nr:tryptophan--tRNA ligase [Pseudomonadota bacterium]
MASSKPTVFSGVQPSGQPTLGNLLGAFQPFVKYQDTHTAFFCVVDHHAITVRQTPEELAENTLSVAARYISCGLDPAKCTLFVQSHVSAHAELGWVLNTFTQMGELERMTQFKDKSLRHAQNINVGLFDYPVLMAADILLYNATEVPVGEDQTQHVELARDIATRFNNLYGPTVTVPKAIIPKAAARVKDLQDPTRKMSKSLGGKGTLFLTDSPAEAAKKIKSSVTDSLAQITYDPENQPGVANLLEILAALTHRTPQEAAKEFKGQQYGALKSAVAEAVVQCLEPLQDRYNGLMADKAELQNILRKGAEKARAVAGPTLARVMDKVGYARF